MRPALSVRKPKYPLSWQQLPCGDQLKSAIQAQLNAVCRQWFGYHLVKLGALSAELSLPECAIKHQVGISRSANDACHLVADAKALPLQERSVDAFLLCFELDYSSDPHQVLREVDRVIMPDGHLAIVGFNPISVAGLARLLPLRRDSLLHDARFFTAMRIKDWMHLLGFEIIEERRLIHSELLFDRPLHQDSRWQRWLAKHCTMLGSVYIMIGKKREMPLSVVKPKWKPNTAFTPAGASWRASRAQLKSVVQSHCD
ncbi:methyltransferase domain-containing protein [Aliiglaciecola sp. CAU 1673]|uniref:class I SAM-dependent methyltransferase n=1 Tax=Aliiglaciecola sp. CAU 1673 TaxID=3032595 RepID=UPI0023DAF1AF|nr:methyltransferase domain-containing protein [Aliiglaciecola sp. CAU 1673]MDF2180269.1 methyltransferase domain-containing protein [Aliiglaciecola sp. CAU 1673]